MAVLLCGFAFLAGCKSQQQAGGDALQKQGYQATQAEYFRAAGNGATAVMTEMIKAGIDPKALNGAGESALHEAARKGAHGSMDFLASQGLAVDAPNQKGETPLMLAVESGNPETVRWLMSHGANVRANDAEGVSVLLRSVLAGKGAVVAEVAPMLRENLDHALLVAAMEGKTEVIDTLTSYGASIYARTAEGKTPLMLAAERGHSDSVKLLLELGSNRYTTDTAGKTAMFYAEKNPEIQALFTEKEVSLPTDEQLSRDMEQQVARQAGEKEPKILTSSGGGVERLGGAVFAAETGEKPATSKATTTGTNSQAAPLVMRSFRQHVLPLQVRSVSGKQAKIVLQDGKQTREISLEEGARVPGTSFEIRQISSRSVSEKDQNTNRDASVVELLDVRNGLKRSVIAGTPSSANDPVALVEQPGSKRRFLAKMGEEFSDAKGTKFRVVDIRPRQMVVEQLDSGEMLTLPLQGAKD